MDKVREDAFTIIKESLKAVLPDAAVIRALEKKNFTGNIMVVAIGKAAWNMASAAKNTLGDKVSRGLVVTQ